MFWIPIKYAAKNIRGTIVNITLSISSHKAKNFYTNANKI